MSAPPSAPSVSSRFVSSKELEAASQKRQEEWKAAYERIGQEPPKQDEGEGTYDPRSLWEKLQENKSKKQEAFEEQLKFKNHFRSLDEDEISFLDSMIDENNDEEVERQKAIREELEGFRKAVTARSIPIPPPSISTSNSHLPLNPPFSKSPNLSTPQPIASTSTLPPPPPPLAPNSKPTPPTTKKGGKKLKGLPGLVVKKKKEKSKITPSPTPPTPVGVKSDEKDGEMGEKKLKRSNQGEEGEDEKEIEGQEKKRKI
ncbi:hypothetical protein JCM5353_002099 [Sporobolomyces roseus]